MTRHDNVTRWCVALAVVTAAACGDGASAGQPDATVGGPGSAPDARAPGAPDARPPTPDATPTSCGDQPTLPLTATSLSGFSGAEDFAFDADGNLVSVGQLGNLTRQPKSGSATLFVSSLSKETAGTRFLPGGDLVVADVANGAVLRIAPNGSVTTMLSGLLYPNGIEVGRDGMVYVAEHDAGQVRRVDPATGAFDIIARGLTSPNGVSFSPDYRTLYVGSFGAGDVYRVTVDDAGNWSDSVVHGHVPSDGFEGGGLDGLTVDACGYIYVTEFITGKIWRFSPDGGAPELVASLSSEWIPNLHWGIGSHGWDARVLYVMERGDGRLFELDLGIPEKPRVYP